MNNNIYIWCNTLILAIAEGQTQLGADIDNEVARDQTGRAVAVAGDNIAFGSSYNVNNNTRSMY